MTKEDKFWGDDPNVLFSTLDFFPLEQMTLNEKINALTRSIICISSISILYYQSGHIIPFVITMILIYLITNHVKKEGFSENDDNAITNANTITNSKTNVNATNTNATNTNATNTNASNTNATNTNATNANAKDKRQIKFQAPSAKNPLSNVLLTDNSLRFPAPPVSNEKVNDDILIQAKKMVQQLNPTQTNIVDKLFKNLDHEMSFEQSLRPFYSTANTTTPNDQGAFAEFCYGNMISCKDGNLFACARNLSNHYNI